MNFGIKEKIDNFDPYSPTWKNTIVIYSKYYSVFEPNYSKVYYIVP